MAFILSIRDSTRELLTVTRQATSSLDETSIAYPNGTADAYTGVHNLASIKTTLSGYAGYITNAKDSYQILTSATEGLAEIQSTLNEMRIVAVLGKTTSLSSELREEWGSVFNQYKDTINAVVNDTRFQDGKLLDGSFTDQSYAVGPNSSDSLNISISGHTPYNLDIGDSNIDTYQDSSDAITAIDKALQAVNANLTNLTAVQTQLDNTLRENNIQFIKLDEPTYRFDDVETLETGNDDVDLQNDRYKYIRLENLEDNTTAFNVTSDYANFGRAVAINPQEFLVFLYERNDLDESDNTNDAHTLSIKL
ncbi:MAG: hypothetical protein HQM16_15375 [Deltaproteobacteria bacterium]|nr:hypothetical protein [Deltaproteobacteria bacterium]